MLNLSLNASQARLTGILAISLLGAACGTDKNSASSVSDAEQAATYEGKVSSCPDGDTCNVKLDDSSDTLKVRLIGIDAPESRGGDDGRGQPLGQEAKTHLNSLIKGKHVKVRVVGTDRYERSLGEIIFGNTVVNIAMLKQGLAEAYIWSNDVINAPKYRNAEKEAKTAHAGIWSLEDYESPEDFRRRMRETGEE